MSTPSEEELVRAAAVAHQKAKRFHDQAENKRRDALIRAQQAMNAQKALSGEMQKLTHFQQLQLRQQLPLRHVTAQQAKVKGLQHKVTMIAAAQFQLANEAGKLKQQEVAEQARFRQLHIQLAALRQSRVVTTTSNEVQSTAKSTRGTKRSRRPPSPERESSPQPPKKPRVSSGAPPAPDRKTIPNDPGSTAATSSQPSGISAWLSSISWFASAMITVETVEKAMNSASCEQKGHSASDIQSWTFILLPIGFKMLQEKIIRSVTRVLAMLFKLHPDVQAATTRRYNPEKMSIHLLYQDFLYVLEFQTGKFTEIETMWESYCLSRNLYETVESMSPQQVEDQMKGLYSGSPEEHIRDTLLRHCASVLVHRIMDYRNRARDDESFDAKKIDKLCLEHQQMLDKIRKKSGTRQD